MAAEATSSSYLSIKIQIQVQMEWLRKTLFLLFSKWSQSSAAPILFFIFMGKQVQILCQFCPWKQSQIGLLLASMWIGINTRTEEREGNFYKSNWTAFKTVWRYPITWMRLFISWLSPLLLIYYAVQIRFLGTIEKVTPRNCLFCLLKNPRTFWRIVTIPQSVLFTP